MICHISVLDSDKKRYISVLDEIFVSFYKQIYFVYMYMHVSWKITESLINPPCFPNVERY